MAAHARRPPRLATAADLVAINDIYNYYVETSTCTYQLDPEPLAGRVAWFEAHGGRHPITVAERAGEVVAWGSLSPYHTRCGYRATVEDSVYVRHDLRGQGLGGALLRDLCERAQKLGHHTVIALISADQDASVALHQRYGFSHAGRLREVGYKLGRYLDVVHMQRMLGPTP